MSYFIIWCIWLFFLGAIGSFAQTMIFSGTIGDAIEMQLRLGDEHGKA